jgi:hypothetical protein
MQHYDGMENALGTPASAMSMLPEYGTDVSTYPDLDDTFAPLSGIRVIAQAMARSLEDAQYGVDLRQWLNESLEAADIAHLQQTIESQCLRDERVQDVSVVVAQPTLYELRIAIDIEPSQQGPFRLTLKVTALTVELLNVEPQ